MNVQAFEVDISNQELVFHEKICVALYLLNCLFCCPSCMFFLLLLQISYFSRSVCPTFYWLESFDLRIIEYLKNLGFKKSDCMFLFFIYNITSKNCVCHHSGLQGISSVKTWTQRMREAFLVGISWFSVPFKKISK